MTKGLHIMLSPLHFLSVLISSNEMQDNFSKKNITETTAPISMILHWKLPWMSMYINTQVAIDQQQQQNGRFPVWL